MDLNVKQLFTSRTLKTNFSTNFGHINIDLNNYSHQGHFKAILPCFFVLDANKYSHRGHSKQSSVIVPKRLMNLSKYSHVTKTPHVLFCHRLKYLMCCAVLCCLLELKLGLLQILLLQLAVEKIRTNATSVNLPALIKAL